ncbi:interleukin-12 subunit beta-like [Discoglossus pictus]
MQPHQIFILCLTLSQWVQSSRALIPDSWPVNYEEVGLHGTYTLQCDSHTDIIWRSPEGSDMESHTLHDLDEPDAGNYTCWDPQGNLITWVYLLIRHQDLSISCYMESLTSPVLQCTVPIDMEMSVYRVRGGESPLQEHPWVYMSSPGEDEPLKFNVTLPKSCPFGEQISVIDVSVEGRTETFTMSGRKSFHVRDIVTPRPPEDVAIRKLGAGNLGVSWQYPSSWPCPRPYFPLLFEIRLTNRDNTQSNVLVEGHQNLTISSIVMSLRLRCRDLYYPSRWSDWSQELTI